MQKYNDLSDVLPVIYINSKDLMISLSDWWYSSFGLDETEESKAIKWVMDKVEKYIYAQPTANVVEVVRCKDCRWKQGSECVRFSDVRPFPDDFCSRAERKEDGEIH